MLAIISLVLAAPMLGRLLSRLNEIISIFGIAFADGINPGVYDGSGLLMSGSFGVPGTFFGANMRGKVSDR